MNAQKTRWIMSLKSFRNVRTLSVCGIMAALAVVLSYVASIEVGPYIRIGFSGLPNNVVQYLFGPAVGAIFGGALDIIKYVIKPTGAFFPGFTISAILSGIIYGSFWYRRKVSLPRVFLAELAVKLLVNVLLNTLWLKLLYGKAFFVLLPARALTNLIMLPIDTAICWALLRFMEKIRGRIGFGMDREEENS